MQMSFLKHIHLLDLYMILLLIFTNTSINGMDLSMIRFHIV